MKASAAQQARHTAASTADDIHACDKCSAIHSPAPPPRPVPPRLPAWNQPPARPFSPSAVPYAIRLSTDMARNVVATLAPKATALSQRSDAATGAIAPSARKPSAHSTAARRYQRFLVSVRSATGAQRNFQVCGTK